MKLMVAQEQAPPIRSVLPISTKTSVRLVLSDVSSRASGGSSLNYTGKSLCRKGSPTNGTGKDGSRLGQVGTEGGWENLEAWSALVCKICTPVPCLLVQNHSQVIDHLCQYDHYIIHMCIEKSRYL